MNTLIKKFTNYLQKFRYKITILISSITLAAHLEKRPLNHEGGQPSARFITEKIDWWGAFLPLITPNDNFIYESLLITSLSVSIFLFGILLIIKNVYMKDLSLIVFFVLIFIGFNFVAANSRDSFLLSFAVLSLGIIQSYKASKSRILIIFLFISLCLMVSFKYLTSISIVLILVYLLLENYDLKLMIRIFTTCVSAVIIVSVGVTLDQNLGKLINLKKSFPEQQPILQDLAMFYCWSDDQSTRSRALESMQTILMTDNPSDICLTLRPNSWAYLVSGSNNFENKVAAPLRKIDNSNPKDLILLRDGWVNTIFRDPVDYLQFKLIAATQIITVGNPFNYPLNFTTNYVDGDKSQNSKSYFSTKIFELSEVLWKASNRILNLVGYTYLFSIIFLFFILFVLYVRARKENYQEHLLTIILFCNIINIALLSIGFVSDEARYVFPIVFITYMILLLQKENYKTIEKNYHQIEFRPN